MGKVQTRLTIGAGLILGLGGLLGADVALSWYAGFRYAPFFWILLVGGLLRGSVELFRMFRSSGYPCQPAIGMTFVGLMSLVVFMETQLEPTIRPWLHERGLEVYLLLVVGLVFATFVARILGVERGGETPARAMAGVGWTLVAVLTVGLLGVFLAKIRFLPRTLEPHPDPLDGLKFLVLTLGVVKCADIGAWAVGTAAGRHKLVPTLSPNKTWEGLGGAFAFGIGAAMAIGCGWAGFGWGQMLLFGGLVSLSGVLGDLAESLMKRACQTKDTGRIPGFGGALDILDSMLAAGPVAYVLLVVLTEPKV